MFLSQWGNGLDIMVHKVEGLGQIQYDRLKGAVLLAVTTCSQGSLQVLPASHTCRQQVPIHQRHQSWWSQWDVPLQLMQRPCLLVHSLSSRTTCVVQQAKKHCLNRTLKISGIWAALCCEQSGERLSQVCSWVVRWPCHLVEVMFMGNRLLTLNLSDSTAQSQELH